MKQGWSAALLFAAVLLLFARYFLHIGGFWDVAALREVERRSPLTALLFSVVSLKRLPDPLHRESPPILTMLVAVVRASLLLGAVLFAGLAALLVVSVFFGGPL